MSVTAIIVTRGDVELDRIIGQDWPDSVHEIVVWNNAEEEKDLGVYGRYAAIKRANFDLIYVQDDDVLLPGDSIQQIIDKWYEAGRYPVKREPSWDALDHLVVNMPANFRHSFYADHALVGFGACFHRDAPAAAFNRFFLKEMPDLVVHGNDTVAHVRQGAERRFLGVPHEFFLRTCDIIFTGLTPYVMVDVPYEDLPWASAENRMWKQPTHREERQRMLDLVKEVAAHELLSR